MIICTALIPRRHAELVSASIAQNSRKLSADKWTLKHVQGDGVFK